MTAFQSQPLRHLTLPRGPLIIATSAALAVSACGRDAAPDQPEPEITDPAPLAAGENGEEASIIRPEMSNEIVEPEPVLKPLQVTIGFPDGGVALDEQAAEGLAKILASPQLAEGGPITLRGHSDSVGGDQQNLLASRLRAEAVRDRLVEEGVAEDRITVIAIGEGRPIAPNRKLDGSQDKEGQARNRRVDVIVALPQEPARDDSNEPETAE